ncbi:MAG: hypothetical protein KGI62_09115 [Xanthomonadaceae bacterium]|nr:hypothetical protein [Xanthomonadaceae bacterium]
MARIQTLLASALAAVVVSSTVWGAAARGSTRDSVAVNFSVLQQNGEFIIKCSPRTRADAQNHEWPSVCNKVGRAAIERAVKQKLIAPVQGPAFGMASEFPPDYSPDPHISNITLSRSFPLIGGKAGTQI